MSGKPFPSDPLLGLICALAIWAIILLVYLWWRA